MTITGIIFAIVFIGLIALLFNLIIEEQSKSIQDVSGFNIENDISKYDDMIVSNSELIDLINSKAFSKCDNRYVKDLTPIVVKCKDNTIYNLGNASDNTSNSISGRWFSTKGVTMSGIINKICYTSEYTKVHKDNAPKIYSAKQFKISILVPDENYLQGNSLIYGVLVQEI